MKDKITSLIQGGTHDDERGSIRFVNDFNMESVKRFYQITHHSTSTIRAWQGHKMEHKWFHCLEGLFEVFLIKVDSWTNPSQDLKPKRILLSASNSQVLHIPQGYANGFRALKNKSSLLVFSNFDVQASIKDDYRFDKNYWPVWQ